MMRVTPFRLITLQCSQIGFTLVLTFTVDSRTRLLNCGLKIGQDHQNTELTDRMQVSPSTSRSTLPDGRRDPGQLGMHPPHRLHRVWGRRDRATEHQVASSRTRSRAGGHDSRLVLRIAN